MSETRAARSALLAVLAEAGVPNWIDTEGHPFGTPVFGFFLSEGVVEPLVAEVVPFDQIGT